MQKCQCGTEMEFIGTNWICPKCSGKMSKDWKEWAKREKAEVYEIAAKYSGSFVRAMVEAFLRADNRNTEKFLNTFPEYFETLYRFKVDEGNR